LSPPPGKPRDGWRKTVAARQRWRQRAPWLYLVAIMAAWTALVASAAWASTFLGFAFSDGFWFGIGSAGCAIAAAARFWTPNPPSDGPSPEEVAADSFFKQPHRDADEHR
jgi:hypothetical protein